MTDAHSIRTLIVEDDPLLAEAHSCYVEQVVGFTVADVVHTGAQALRRIAGARPDLVLLDLYLPDMAGLEVCRALRARGTTLDVIAVTSARDLPTVHAALSYGVVQYLMKPFGFAAFRGRLERYAAFRAQLTNRSDVAVGQREIDSALAVLRPGAADRGHAPKGLSDTTLDAVATCLRTAAAPMSADDVGRDLGLSRVSARRYLECLADQGLVGQTRRYGQPGRPGHLFHWLPGGPA